MQTVSRIATVWFPLNQAAGAITPFPEMPDLVGEHEEIVGIMAYTTTDVQLCPDGVQCIGALDSLELVLTFNAGSNERLKDIPYADLCRSFTGGVWYEVEPFRIDLGKCTAQTMLGLSVPCNAIIAFMYRTKV